MIVRPRIVDVYEAANGFSPFGDYMRKLKDLQGKAAIDARIARLRHGSLGKYRDIGEGLIELKLEIGYRIYLADNGRNSLLLLAGAKKTQDHDIKAAKAYWKDYKARA